MWVANRDGTVLWADLYRRQKITQKNPLNDRGKISINRRANPTFTVETLTTIAYFELEAPCQQNLFLQYRSHTNYFKEKSSLVSFVKYVICTSYFFDKTPKK